MGGGRKKIPAAALCGGLDMAASTPAARRVCPDQFWRCVFHAPVRIIPAATRRP